MVKNQSFPTDSNQAKVRLLLRWQGLCSRGCHRRPWSWSGRVRSGRGRSRVAERRRNAVTMKRSVGCNFSFGHFKRQTLDWRMGKKKVQNKLMKNVSKVIFKDASQETMALRVPNFETLPAMCSVWWKFGPNHNPIGVNLLLEVA